MLQYIGNRVINAKPMKLREYNTLRGWDTPEHENLDASGYLVEYLDGGRRNHPNYDNYISWSPTAVLENRYKRFSSKPHEQRVIEEKNTLDVKINKLQSFIETNKIFNDLEEYEKQNLKLQLEKMKEYSTILGTRIGCFK